MIQRHAAMPSTAVTKRGGAFTDTLSTPTFLTDTDLRLILFGGKGGVGKTTCAASAALCVAAAAPRERVLLVSTDPAHSLEESLMAQSAAGNLKTVEFDAGAHLENFKAENEAIFVEMARRGTFLDEADIRRFLDLSLPGLDELMAFMQIARWSEDETYRVIVVDTAPTGHTLRLLQMPVLARLWLSALDTLLAKHRYMKKVFSGRYAADRVDDFVLDMSERIEQFTGLLQDHRRCRFIPVALADHLSLYETRMLLGELGTLGMGVDEIVINQWVPPNECGICEHKRRTQIETLNRAAVHLSPFRLWSIPHMPEEVRGRQGLQDLWQQAALMPPLPAPSAGDRSGVRADPPPTDPMSGPPAPLPGHRLLIFAGKGGVGKTTLACATAMALSRRHPDRRILLFSTDPAHSLSACLNRKVQREPTRIRNNLFALEMDGPAEFEALKQEYAGELRDFLENLAPGFDFTFDREVMEKLMDLAPTGIDEVMAVTRSMEMMEKGEYHTMVLDAAPTGHLIRLLETPDLIRQWLRVFFDLFLKYKRIFRLPDMARRMVEISKGVKGLNKRLQDEQFTAVLGVAILTEMALAETRDLAAACRRLGVRMPTLFLNLATPPGQCPLCRALAQREREVRKRFETRLGDAAQIIIPYQPYTVGIEAMEQLGGRMYGRPQENRGDATT